MNRKTNGASGLQSRFTGRQLTILAICATALFLGLALFTYALGTDDEAVEQQPVYDIEQDHDEEKDSIVVTPPEEGDPYKELDELIGLESVKEEVRSLVNFVKVQKKREEKGLKTPKMSYHLVFTGSPGTGKTTVARIVARIYKDLGILKIGHMVETDRSGLIGRFVGQTAPRVDEACNAALDGVLFIDEAYALTQSENNSDYGAEAVATLLKRMEDNRDRLVVIVAGYTNEMRQFINSNPGLQSRFNRYINFPDYTSGELYDIFQLYLRKNEYTISNEAGDYLQQGLERVVNNKDRNFGNARYVRNLFEKAIQCQANRLAKMKNVTNDELKELTMDDIKEALRTQKTSI